MLNHFVISSFRVGCLADTLREAAAGFEVLRAEVLFFRKRPSRALEPSLAGEPLGNQYHVSHQRR